MSDAQKEDKIYLDLAKRRDDYLRHTFQLLLSWFTVWLTVNYFSMGWVAANWGKVEENVGIVVAFAFVFQNVLGIFICIVIGIYFKGEAGRLLKIEQVIDEPANSDGTYSSAYPLWVYLCGTGCMILAILAMLGCWGFIWSEFADKHSTDANGMQASREFEILCHPGAEQKFMPLFRTYTCLGTRNTKSHENTPRNNSR